MNAQYSPNVLQNAAYDLNYAKKTNDITKRIDENVENRQKWTVGPNNISG